jgi:hypothetical protein
MRRYLLSILLVGACTSDDPAPTVTVLSANPGQINPENDLLDDVRIVVEYADADGDLGEGIAQIHDCRAAPLLTELIIPAIAPESLIKEGSPISGSLDLHLTDVGAVPPSTMPSVCADLGVKALRDNETVFCVVLVDAKDHVGPGDCTPVIELAPL